MGSEFTPLGRKRGGARRESASKSPPHRQARNGRPLAPQGLWLYWTWKSWTRLGGPRLSAEVRYLIATVSRDNPLWGSERIRGELLKLGIIVSKRSIRRYRWQKPAPGGSQAWRTFLANELRGIWAADLLVVQTIGYRIVYVLFFIRHDRRELVHFNVTSSCRLDLAATP
jgi:putative transposase